MEIKGSALGLRWAAVAALVIGCVVHRAESFTRELGTQGDGARLVVVGDFQRTAPVLEFWRESNDVERERVVRGIVEARPDLLAITGDCVFNGASDAQWVDFDALTRPLRRAGIPALMAFGNHEYWLGRAEAEAHVFPRFPLMAGRHAYTVAFGRLRLLVLDSNDGRFGAAEWAAQRVWYERTLTELDADPTVRGVMVLTHHPPYTNSTVTGDEMQVQTVFVPPFMRARKTLAMLAGHVHSYERYEREGKVFIVSGGGGGPRVRLAMGGQRRHPEDLFDGPEIRDFHFTVYTVTALGIDARVRGLRRGETNFRDMDRFAMRWPE